MSPGLRFGQVRGALCQHGDDLVEVPVDVTREMPWSRASPLGQPGAARRSRAGRSGPARAAGARTVRLAARVNERSGPPGASGHSPAGVACHSRTLGAAVTP